MDASAVPAARPHRAVRAKKKTTSAHKQAIAKPGAFARRIGLAADRAEKRAPNPAAPVDRSGGDAAPRVVAVVGPKGVGKSTIIRNLVKHYSKRKLVTVTGPVTVVSGRKKRVTFVEVGPDLSCMIDAAKIADLVLLVIDASFGFEMETFEFLNIAAAHGMPKVMGVLTHLDSMREGKQVSRTKKVLKDRFWAELYDGAKLFYLSGITTTGDYLNREILNLARFISVTKFANIRWRAEHPYVLADRVEDITPKDIAASANRRVAAYGYIRGTPLRVGQNGWRVHVAGVGDLSAVNVEVLPDPCPAPDMGDAEGDGSGGDKQKRRRKIGERERLIYAPMAPEVDGISYDRDAIYINLDKDSVRFSDKSALVADAPASSGSGVGEKGQGVEDEADGNASSDGEGEVMVKNLQKTTEAAMDERLGQASLQLVKGGKRIVSEQFKDGRRRRRVVFNERDGEAGVSGRGSESGSDSGSDSESDSGDSGLSPVPSDLDDTDDGEDGDDDDESAKEDSEESGDDDDMAERTAMRWKDRMLDNAAARMRSSLSPSKALTRFIYGKGGKNSDSGETTGANPLEGNEGRDLGNGEDNDDDGDSFFRPRRPRGSASAKPNSLPVFSNAVLGDMTRLRPDAARDWSSDVDACSRLRRSRFGTGRRRSGAGDDDNDGLEGDSDDANEEFADGDFEDLETGEVHQGSAKGGDKAAKDGDLSDSDMDEIRMKKIRQKELFDAEWDGKGRRHGSREDEDGDSDGASGDESAIGRPNHLSRQAARSAADHAPDLRKLERERLEKLRSEEFAGMDKDTRLALEGVLPGRYVRMELEEVPVEFVKYFDPRVPVVIGGLKAADDEGMTFVRARIRRHRFKRGVLKSSDPVVLSVGWRRFQSVPVYDVEDQGGRRRFLKYTPEYLHCHATFWAPSVAPGAGLIMCQSLGRDRAGFRIAGSGVVTELDASFKVVKKLKLVGEPIKVHRNTAFIKGMFNSELEVSKFIGASVRTVSGIRGTIKKAVSEGSKGGSLDRDIAKSPSGSFRAGFEGKILLSDIVFLRAWVPVEAPRFCSIATTLLDRAASGEETWRMRTVREVRQARQLPIPLKTDSLYKPVDRVAPKFAPLKIPKKLEGALPYASKPKNFASKRVKQHKTERKAAMATERAVVMDSEERKQHSLLQAMYTIRNDREKKRKAANAKRLETRKKEFAREDAKHAQTTAETRKRKFALDGARAAKDNAKRSRSGGGRND